MIEKILITSLVLAVLAGAVWLRFRRPIKARLNVVIREAVIAIGYASIILIWWGSNWKVALGASLALCAHTYLTRHE